MRRLPHLIASLATLAGFSSCLQPDEEPYRPNRTQEQTSPAEGEEAAPPIQLGMRVEVPDQEAEFVPWTGVGDFNALLKKHAEASSLQITFLPGTYILEDSIAIHGQDQVHLRGEGEVHLQFHQGTDDLGIILDPLLAGEQTFRVTRPERIKPLERYQLFQPNGGSDRLLEFIVYKVEEDLVTMGWGAHFMPHVSSIPAKSRMVEDINIFEIKRSSNLTFENLRLDGMDRGDIRGHTTFCGIYAIGDYEIGRRPITSGMTVRNCHFSNLSGRGVAFYGMKDVIIEDCRFQNIRAQAIEIDHFSSGIIRNNWVQGAETGVMINDAFDSIVEHNALIDCREGVRFLMLFYDEWANTGNVVQNNRIGPGCETGVMFDGSGLRGNTVRNNMFYYMPDDKRVTNSIGNTVEFLPEGMFED